MTFVLDEAGNPHPVMRRQALYFRSIAYDSTEAMAFWLGYRTAMADATGCEATELDAWLDKEMT